MWYQYTKRQPIGLFPNPNASLAFLTSTLMDDRVEIPGVIGIDFWVDIFGSFCTHASLRRWAAQQPEAKGMALGASKMEKNGKRHRGTVALSRQQPTVNARVGALEVEKSWGNMEGKNCGAEQIGKGGMRTREPVAACEKKKLSRCSWQELRRWG